MAKVKTPADEVLKEGKEKKAESAKEKPVKKKLSDMTDLEKIEYYKNQISKEKKKNKELQDKIDILSEFINENYDKLNA